MRAKKKQLTLDEAWDLCLEQWDWVKAQIEAWSKLSVGTLKCQWCKENGYEGVRSICFFCEYDKQCRGERPCCDFCPGVLVDSKFSCGNNEYDYEYKHLAFHAELVRLNNIRLGLKE